MEGMLIGLAFLAIWLVKIRREDRRIEAQDALWFRNARRRKENS